MSFETLNVLEEKFPHLKRNFRSLGLRQNFSLSRHPCFLQRGHLTQRVRSAVSLDITVVNISERHLELVSFF